MNCRYVLVALVSVMMVGCGSRFYERHNVTVGDTLSEAMTVDVSAAGRKRTLRVTGEATAGLVDVYIFLKENQAEIEQRMMVGKGGRLMLKGVEDTKDIALIATVPPDKAAVVMVRASSREGATVELTVAD